jgi:hypothetical protein
VLSFARAVVRRFAERAATIRPGWTHGWRVRPIADGHPHAPDIPAPSRARRQRPDRPKAGDCMWLEIEKLIRQGILVPGARRNGAIGWRDNFTCEEIPLNRCREYRCSVTYDANLDEPATASLWLKFWMRDPATGHEREIKQQVGVAKRWGALWFCDHGRCSKRLCQPNNGARFAPPQAWGIRFPNPPRDRARIRHPAAQSDPNPPPNPLPPGGYETAPIRSSAGDPSTEPVANATRTGWPADKRPAKSDAQQSRSCGRRPEKDDEHIASSPARGRWWAWSLAKVTLVKRAFVGNRHGENDRTRSSTNAARANRATGLLAKVAQARTPSNGALAGSGKPSWCRPPAPWPACPLGWARASWRGGNQNDNRLGALSHDERAPSGFGPTGLGCLIS